MKVSIVIAVLNSHEIVRRQLIHFNNMDLPDDTEILLVDDGSTPPIRGDCKNLRIHKTNNFEPWTQPEARNIGVRLSMGEYVICTDIDHILSLDLINYIRKTDADVVRFKREVGVLNSDGSFTQDMITMISYGLLPSRGKGLPPHGNSYAIKRDLFIELGGSKSNAEYPNRDELRIKRRIRKLFEEGKIKVIHEHPKPTIFMFPNGRFCGEKDYNPFSLFHNLKR